MRNLLVCLCLLVGGGWAWGAEFYIDPVKGSPQGDGSAAKPWRSLRHVLSAKKIESRNWERLPYRAGAKLLPRHRGAPVKAGDTIFLRSGNYGEIIINGYYNAKPITIAAYRGQTPKFSRILVRSSANWRFRGLFLSPSYASSYTKKIIFETDEPASSGPVEKVTLEDSRLFSVLDASRWTAKDWNAKAAIAVRVRGKEITIRRNRITNINMGISVLASRSLVDSNVIDGFSGDGLRGLGDYTTFQYNRVQNCYKVNENHDDGFQSWSVGRDGKVGTGQVVGVVLRGNIIINATNPNQKLRCSLQGIGMFDGTFVNWVIENNVIIVDHWHGITLAGAKNVRIINNTLFDPNSTKPGPPWIRIAPHKNGTKPSGCIVRNNLVPKLNNDKIGVREDSNLTYQNPADHFVHPKGFDLHLKPSSSAIDRGNAQLAPKADADRKPRLQGRAIDIGAYEFSQAPSKPEKPQNEPPLQEKRDESNLPEEAPSDAGSPDQAPDHPTPESPAPDPGSPPESSRRDTNNSDSSAPPDARENEIDPPTPETNPHEPNSPLGPERGEREDSFNAAPDHGKDVKSGGSNGFDGGRPGVRGSGCVCHSNDKRAPTEAGFLFLLVLGVWGTFVRRKNDPKST